MVRLLADAAHASKTQTVTVCRKVLNQEVYVHLIGWGSPAVSCRGQFRERGRPKTKFENKKIPDASAPGNLLEVTTRFELVDEGFADPCLTTWPRHHIWSDYYHSCWSGRRGSNSLPPPWQGGALPDELRPHIWCIYPCTHHLMMP